MTVCKGRDSLPRRVVQTVGIRRSMLPDDQTTTLTSRYSHEAFDTDRQRPSYHERLPLKQLARPMKQRNRAPQDRSCR